MNGTDDERRQRQAVAAALVILGRRNHTAAELADKLQRKGFDAAACDAAQARCRELGYLDDALTGQLMVESMHRRGLGVHRIRAHLREKGLAADLVERLTRDDADTDTALAAARDACRRKQPTFDREPDPTRRRAKIHRFLQSRGFPAEVIHHLIREQTNSPAK